MTININMEGGGMTNKNKFFYLNFLYKNSMTISINFVTKYKF